MDRVFRESRMEERSLYNDVRMGPSRFRADAKSFEVCPSCRGKGKVVNPSIDAGGLDMSEMSHEFQEDYFSGIYDIGCRVCDGKRVVAVEEEAVCSEGEGCDCEICEPYVSHWNDPQVRAERAMGA